MNTYLHSHCVTNAPQLRSEPPLCLAQKLTESGSLRGLEHCRGLCAVRTCNLSILYEHAWNHAHFVLYYCTARKSVPALRHLREIDSLLSK